MQDYLSSLGCKAKVVIPFLALSLLGVVRPAAAQNCESVQQGVITSTLNGSTQYVNQVVALQDSASATKLPQRWRITGPTGAVTYPTIVAGTASWTPATMGNYSANVVAATTFSGPASCLTGGPFNFTVATPSSPVFAYPRYIVVGVTYAPPGPSSFVTYSQSGTVGTTVSSGNSFSSTTSVTTSISGSGGINGIASGKVTSTVTSAATQGNSSSNMTTLSLQTTSTTKTGGPSNAYAPINHDYDIIWLWLNPVAQYNVTTGSTQGVTFSGFGFDMADEPQMDIWPVYVGELNGHFAMEAGTQAEFTRSWATSGKYFPAGDGPAITSNDYANILAADPFTGNYTFSVNNNLTPVTTYDGRFSLAAATQGGVQQIDYVPGLSQTYSLSTSNASTTGTTTSHSFSETFSVDISAEEGAAVASFLSDLKVSNQLTWTHTQGNSTMKSTTYTNALSVSGPCTTAAGCSPAYTGLSVFNVYQDNIWGTFYFAGIR